MADNMKVRPGDCYKHWDDEADECSKCLLAKECREATKRHESGQAVLSLEEAIEKRKQIVKGSEEPVEQEKTEQAPVEEEVETEAAVSEEKPKRKGRPPKKKQPKEEEAEKPVEEKKAVEEEKAIDPYEYLWEKLAEGRKTKMSTAGKFETRKFFGDNEKFLIHKNVDTGKMRFDTMKEKLALDALTTVEEADKLIEEIQKHL